MYLRNKFNHKTIDIDTQHHVFGAFMTEPWKPNNPRYYGGGESFVFQLEPHMKIYKWTRKNNHFMLTDTGSIAVGGGYEEI